MAKTSRAQRKQAARLNSTNAKRRQRYAAMAKRQGASTSVVLAAPDPAFGTVHNSSTRGMTNQQKKRQKLGKNPQGAGPCNRVPSPYAWSPFGW